MERFDLWQKWLFVVGLLIIIFGVMMTFLNGTMLFDMINDQVNPVFWDDGNIPDETKDFQGWIYAVLGSAMAGWGIFIIFIAHYPFQKKEQWSWNCLVTGLSVWFCLDTAFSLYFEVYFNAVFNTALFLLVIVPLAFTRNDFMQS
ncbi:MAG: hypothetical protein ACFFDT_27020 [Candidatus Hodarchaeota archaeon]